MINSVNDESKNDSEILRRRVYCNLLYDFYSPLLTERQRKVYETLCFSDLTLSEAADVLGISRQGVYILVRNVMQKLESIEKELNFAASTQKLENKIKELEEENKSLRVEIKKLEKKIRKEEK
ncbi:MAG: DNA-binding protein [Synergistaceae bacterium]|nr:DNA-binding protein [Synergistaceae bacterium]